MDLQENKKALEFFMKSYELIKKWYGKEHHLISAKLNNIGIAYQNLGNSKNISK